VSAPSADELIEAVRALPPGRGFLAPPASPQALNALAADLGRPLPADLRELLLRSDGIGVAASCGYYLESVAGLRRLAGDDLYMSAFPGALLVGSDGASGLYLLAADGRVLLTDRGSLLPRDTVVAGASVSEVLAAVLAGTDLWILPRLGG
jgi:SMI1/KNR4 family protein SUKH-1